MAAIKKTLLQIVQEILSDLDSEDVDSITDTLEALQVVKIVESTFYNLIATRDIPEHYELIKLTAESDSNRPTHFQYPENTNHIDKVWYATNDTGDHEYTEIQFMEPMDFLYRIDRVQSDYQVVTDKSAGTSLRIVNNCPPRFYTSFDDENIVMDSFKSTIDSTLQQSKVRAFGSVLPIFDSDSDDYVPDIDGVMFPHLIAEAKSTAFSILKGGVDQKIEQAARRQKSYIQNDKYKTVRGNTWNDYGRS